MEEEIYYNNQGTTILML